MFSISAVASGELSCLGSGAEAYAKLHKNGLEDNILFNNLMDLVINWLLVESIESLTVPPRLIVVTGVEVSQRNRSHYANWIW